MIRMFVRHQVDDFAPWKEHYDGFDAKRQEYGVRDHAVFAGAEDVNDVTVWHDFDDIASAQAFVNSDELRSAMAAAGVRSEPQVWFVNRSLP